MVFFFLTLKRLLKHNAHREKERHVYSSMNFHENTPEPALYQETTLFSALKPPWGWGLGGGGWCSYSLFTDKTDQLGRDETRIWTQV